MVRRRKRSGLENAQPEAVGDAATSPNLADVAGFCAGPGLVTAGMAQPKALAFVGAMLAGMAAHELIARRKSAAAGMPNTSMDRAP